MKRSLFISAAIGGLMLMPVMASAQTYNNGNNANVYGAESDSGWYISGFGGMGANSEMDLTGEMLGGLKAEANGAGAAQLGYDFGNNWRLEADYGQQWNELGLIGEQNGSSADLRTTTGMINALYDFDGFGRWTPSIGAGLGVVEGSLSAVAHDIVLGYNSTACNVAGAVACRIIDKDQNFGWQFLAGLGYEITENLTWDNQYRYINGGDLDFIGHANNQLTTPINATLQNFAAHQLLTGLRYRFGASAPRAAVRAPAPLPAPAPMPAPAPEPTYYTCWDGSSVLDLANCASRPVAPAPAPVVVEEPTYVSCSDGSYATSEASCPQAIVEQYIAPVVEYVAPQAFLNSCGPSNIAIFNVKLDKTPKSISRLGTMPEFGDSHGLTPSQFYEKLATRYAANANGDRPYLNYLFKSMGYTGGFKDAHAGLFTEELLPAGTSGLLGLGKIHHYAYSVLNTSDHDRQAFRIQSANGSVVHFMKTCGNYMYACQ